MGVTGGEVADKIKSSLGQYTPLAMSALIQQFAVHLKLWIGCSAPGSMAHVLNGILQGSLPFRQVRGSCKVLAGVGKYQALLYPLI